MLYNTLKLIVGPSLFFLLFLGVSIPRIEAAGQDLNLNTFINKEGWQPGAPNVHPMLGCEICHAVVPEIEDDTAKTKDGKKKKAKEPLLFNYPTDKEESLCLSCHEGYALHSYGQKPDSLNPPMYIPDIFPLGTYGQSNKRITCTTCHRMHSDTTLNSFLRGLPENLNEIGKTAFKNRFEFCQACHSQSSNIRWNPHDRNDTEKCQKCHRDISDLPALKKIDDPKERLEAAGETLKGSIGPLCSFCHSETGSGTHYLSVNAFADQNIMELFDEMDLPLLNDKFSCITCHDPHGETKAKAFLRPDYIFFSAQSNRIIPHRKDEFCPSCHEKKPEKGKPFLKFKGKINNLCNWCHSTKEAKKDIHPVGMKFKEDRTLRIPEQDKLPLDEDGKLTCMTCHYPGHVACLTKDEDIKFYEDEENPKLIRGGLPKNIWDFCYACHIRQNFKKFNAHEQIDKNTGEILEKSCAFCHLSRPDRNVIGMKKKNMRMNPVFICLGCHPDRPHPGTKPNHLTNKVEGVFHLVMPVERPGKLKIPEGMIVSKRGRISCVTCHNPHQKGVIRTLRKKGAGVRERRRFDQCTDCHYGQ